MAIPKQAGPLDRKQTITQDGHYPSWELVQLVKELTDKINDHEDRITTLEP